MGKGVREAIDHDGSATVHIVLRGGRPMEERPSRAQERAYRKEIAEAHRAFRASKPDRGLRILHEHDWTFGLVAEVDSGGLSALERMPQVAHVYLDGTVRAHLAEGVPLIGADIVQNAGSTGAGMTIAIIDTGIDYTHPALGGCFGAGCKVVAGHDFVNNDGDPMDDNGHGTGVAGIAASNQGAFLGVAPDASLAALKVLNSLGSGSFLTVDVALNWVLSNRSAYNIQVVNMSLGDGSQHSSSGDLTCFFTNTAGLIRTLVSAGVAVTASSGNEGYDNGVGFPACVAQATAVGGVYDADVGSVSWCGNSSCTSILCTDNPTFAGKFVCHTSAGPPLDILAPNYMTTTTRLGGGSQSFGGTSASAPYAAGAFALMKGIAPGAPVSAIEATLKSTGVPVVNPDSGVFYPRIDVAAAAQSFDADLDGHPDVADNCPGVPNPSQSDFDGDGTGNICDALCDVGMSQAFYEDGDPVTISVLRFANTSGVTLPTRLRLQLMLPGGNALNMLDASFTLPAGHDADLGPATLFTLDPGKPRGTFTLRCALEDPASGGIQAEDTSPFEFR